MPNAAKLAHKQAYFDKLISLCVNSTAGLIVDIDHVTSRQLADIRLELRGKATVLMGKNTMIRKGLSIGHEKHPDAGMDKLRAVMAGNKGFIFAQTCTLDHVRNVIKQYRKEAAAKTGQTSLVDMHLPAGPTGMDPSQTAFFQALNIATKIVKGQIELVSAFPILKIGEVVSPSACQLLGKLSVKPFEYGMEVRMVYQDASVFDAAVLDIKDDVLITKFITGVANMAAFSREIGIPTAAGLPHMFGNAFRNVAALVSDIDFTFKEVETVKQFLEDPDAFAAANPVAASSAPAASGAAPAAAAAAAAVEEEEEEDMDFDLFG